MRLSSEHRRAVSGDKLKQLREKRLRLTQERLAQLLDISFASINRWESSSATGPRGPALTMLRALDVASRADPTLAARLLSWEARGSNFLWARVFGLARKKE